MLWHQDSALTLPAIAGGLGISPLTTTFEMTIISRAHRKIGLFSTLFTTSCWAPSCRNARNTSCRARRDRKGSAGDGESPEGSSAPGIFGIGVAATGRRRFRCCEIGSQIGGAVFPQADTGQADARQLEVVGQPPAIARTSATSTERISGLSTLNKVPYCFAEACG
jgi:hypothetical protein